MIIELLKSLVLGIVQGFTEFLPISSTAHLIIGSSLLKLEMNDFMKSYVIIIQLASILAVIIFFWKKLWSNRLIYFKKLIIAFIPTAIIGFLAYSLVKNFLQESLAIIALALLLGGALMLKLERRYSQGKKEEEKSKELDIGSISYQHCFLIGLFQSLAIIPGVSRSAATILGGLSLGINRRLIVEFSFFLAIPTMIAASFLDLFKGGLNFSSSQGLFLALGFIASFFVAWFSIKFLLSFIKKYSFRVFAWYRVVLGTIILSFLYL